MGCSTILFGGCATASSAVIVTGTVRPPIDCSEVQIVASMPENCEVIAMIKASSDVGFNEQQCYDYAIEELKIRAAGIGGNAVLIENMGSRTEAYIYSNGYMIPTEEHFIVGKALYIPASGL